MGKFIEGQALTEKIREITAGKDVKCAVAYWGEHGFEGHKSFKIVCDIVSGATSPEALIQLAAPNNSKLRHYPHLHAKVYMSDRGVVVGSANASARGLNLGERSGCLLEAGTFHETKEPAWLQASKWFDQLYSGAAVVDAAALELARASYRPPALPFEPSAGSNTPDLLDLVRLRPERFSENEISFIFYEGTARRKVFLETLADISSDGQEDFLETYENWNGEWFCNFDQESLRSYLIGINFPGKRPPQLLRLRVHLSQQSGEANLILARRAGGESSFRRALGNVGFALTEERWGLLRDIAYNREAGSFKDEDDEFGRVISARDLAAILRQHLA